MYYEAHRGGERRADVPLRTTHRACRRPTTVYAWPTVGAGRRTGACSYPLACLPNSASRQENAIHYIQSTTPRRVVRRTGQKHLESAPTCFLQTRMDEDGRGRTRTNENGRGRTRTDEDGRGRTRTDEDWRKRTGTDEDGRGDFDLFDKAWAGPCWIFLLKIFRFPFLGKFAIFHLHLWARPFLGEMQRIAFRLMLSSCVCVCVCVCLCVCLGLCVYIWTSGKRFEIETPFFF